MSQYTDIPQTPRAKRTSRFEPLGRDAASPSSSTGSSAAEDCQYDVSKKAPAEAERLAPSPLHLEKDVMRGKHDASSSPFLRSIDDVHGVPRNPPPYHRTGPTFFRLSSPAPALSRPSSSAQHHSFIVKNCIYSKMAYFWTENSSYLLVIFSTFFSSVMTLLTKLLEGGDRGMGPFQILFIRMAVSTVACSILLFFRKRSEFLFGPRGITLLLLGRGASGFFGICGIWTAIQFLDLADATVITFLTPSLVAIFSAIFMRKPFTRKEQIASLLALVGVVFIARPAMVFGNPPSGPASAPPVSAVTSDGHSITQASPPAGDDATAADRFKGTMLAVVSAVGAAGAFIAIREIGDRASILTTTNFFAGICTLFTGTALAITPLLPHGPSQLRFALPHDQTQWILLVAITICGFFTQLLLTAGIGGETKSNKAPAMVYTGMLWTAGFDKWVFGQEMYWSSLLGCALIVGGAVWMVVQPKPEDAAKPAAGDVEDTAGAGAEEAADMLVELNDLGSAPHSPQEPLSPQNLNGSPLFEGAD